MLPVIFLQLLLMIMITATGAVGITNYQIQCLRQLIGDQIERSCKDHRESHKHVPPWTNIHQQNQLRCLMISPYPRITSIRTEFPMPPLRRRSVKGRPDWERKRLFNKPKDLNILSERVVICFRAEQRGRLGGCHSAKLLRIIWT